jgi:hypothetical protein
MRLEKLGKLIKQLDQAGARPALEIKFAWTENGQPRVEDLMDILRLESPARREEFVKWLALTESGLGSFNVKADQTVLPGKRVPAEVLIAVRVAAPPRK